MKELFGILFISVALAMDAFTVSVSGGAVLAKPRLHQSALVGLYFGGFQFLMPIIGWFVGKNFRVFIDSYDHWVAFALLMFIGVKMIMEAFGKSDKDDFVLSHKMLLVLALATSIDALGVGLSFAFLEQGILFPSVIIGIVTFIFSVCGFSLGKALKILLKNKALILGGVILIAISLRILYGHGVFGN